MTAKSGQLPGSRSGHHLTHPSSRSAHPSPAPALPPNAGRKRATNDTAGLTSKPARTADERSGKPRPTVPRGTPPASPSRPAPRWRPAGHRPDTPDTATEVRTHATAARRPTAPTSRHTGLKPVKRHKSGIYDQHRQPSTGLYPSGGRIDPTSGPPSVIDTEVAETEYGFADLRH